MSNACAHDVLDEHSTAGPALVLRSAAPVSAPKNISKLIAYAQTISQVRVTRIQCVKFNMLMIRCTRVRVADALALECVCAGRRERIGHAADTDNKSAAIGARVNVRAFNYSCLYTHTR